MIRNAAGRDELMRIEDKELRDRWVAEIDRLRKEPPTIMRRSNVVALLAPRSLRTRPIAT
jgi:hypothetical protein